MKVSLLGVLAMFSVALVAYANVMNYGYYPVYYQHGSSGGRYGGIFQILIFCKFYTLFFKIKL